MRPLCALAASLLMSLGCAVDRAPDKGGPDALTGKIDGEFLVPHFDKRSYLLHLPPGYDGETAIPVVIALHGGGAHNESALRVTCKDGDENDPSCITAVADREGFAVVAPNGVPGDPFEDVRTWNAGGGSGGFQCVSGAACKDAVDDMRYLDAVFDEIERAVVVDEDRVYATGISNGGAMAERLACERSTRFAAVAPVAAGTQVALVQGCNNTRPVPILEIHGTADPCWNFEQGDGACLQDDGGIKIGVEETVNGWADRNGCLGDVVTEPLDDAVDDGTTTTRETHGGCLDGGDVVLLKTEGAGHTWPGGWQYEAKGVVGVVAQDYVADDEIWKFFDAHPRVISAAAPSGR